MQTKLESFIEATINIGIGYGIGLGSQLILFPMFGIIIPFSSNLWISLWFTLIGLSRSYIIRRWFNKRLHKAAHRLANRIEH